MEEWPKCRRPKRRAPSSEADLRSSRASYGASPARDRRSPDHDVRLLLTVPEAQLREDQSDLSNWTRGDGKARFEQTAGQLASAAGWVLSRSRRPRYNINAMAPAPTRSRCHPPLLREPANPSRHWRPIAP